MYYEIQITIYEFENSQAGRGCIEVKKKPIDEIIKDGNTILQKSLAKIHSVP